MVFNSLDIHARILGLLMDMMNRVYWELIGGWIGRYISADVDEEGMAWGEDLRVGVVVEVDQPLLRVVSLKESEEDKEGRWVGLKYENVPHFCYDYKCLVHPDKCVCEGEERGI
jgi:hypothetical protein